MNSPTKWLLVFFLALVGCAVAPTAAPTPLPGPVIEWSRAPARLKLFVQADGLYCITAGDLRIAGVDLEKVDAATLQLFRGARAVPMRERGEGTDRAFEFFGQASDSPYSAFGVYWLTWGAQPGARMRETESPAPRDAPQESFPSTVHLARALLYLPQFGEGDAPWFWQALTAPATTTITLTLPAAVSAPAQMRVNLWSATQDPAEPDHHLQVFFNDTRVADESWDGQGARVITARLPADGVRAGVNTLRLSAPGDTRAQAEIVLLRSVEATYSRQFIAQDDALEFEGGAGSYRIGGFSGDAIDVFDITHPDEPTRLANTTIAARTVAFGSDADTPRRYLAVGPRARQPIARIAPMVTTRTQTANADYVVITHPDFVDAVQPLVQWRAQRGLKPVVVATNEIYDEFAYGVESPVALRAFLDSLQPQPRFVLLVGKASYDYRDYLSVPGKNLVPTFLVNTPHLNQAASDNWFAAASARDARPTFAIGRIPAQTKEQVARGVSKIIAFEASPRTAEWRRRAIFVADDKEPSFVEMADALADRMSAQIAAQKIYLAAHQGNVTAARAKMVAQWNAGARWLTYVGHGSIDTWAEGPLFSTANLGEIKNADRLPILFTPTCLDGFFYHPQKDSLAEELLFKEDGGIVAGIVPTGLSLPEDQRALMLALFDEFLAARVPTLGEALTRAKQRMDAATPSAREVIETFGLLGDPALEW